MNKFYFVIDSRESKLLEVYGERTQTKKMAALADDDSDTPLMLSTTAASVVWSVKPQFAKYVKFAQLPVGDVCFYDGDQCVVLIERKEVRDLSSCIDSGSYKEQKLRMLKFQSENPGLQLIYLVENFSVAQKADLETIVNASAPKKQHKTIKTLMSAIVGTMLRDNFFVMTTQGFEGTVAFIERVYEKWPDYRGDLASRSNQQTSASADYLQNVKVVKKDNITPANWYLTALAQIPGVSIDKATCVQAVYPNLKNLLDKYQSLAMLKEREVLLQNIVCGGRKLGPVCSKRICEFVCVGLV